MDTHLQQEPLFYSSIEARNAVDSGRVCRYARYHAAKYLIWRSWWIFSNNNTVRFYENNIIHFVLYLRNKKAYMLSSLFRCFDYIKCILCMVRNITKLNCICCPFLYSSLRKINNTLLYLSSWLHTHLLTRELFYSQCSAVLLNSLPHNWLFQNPRDFLQRISMSIASLVLNTCSDVYNIYI